MPTAGREGARRHTSFNNKSLSGQTLLVVEDQRSLATMQAMMYRERWGCEVHIADSLGKTRELLERRHDYAMAVCDLNLPDAPNGEVIDAVIGTGIPTIAVTAAFGGELRERMLDKGVLDYVLKNNINAYGYICDLIGRLTANRKTKVLVVDDCESMRSSLALTLSRLRLGVLTANNGNAALQAIADHPDIRMVITDFNMPGMDGLALTLELRKHYGKDVMGILGIAGSENALLPAHFLKSGANDFISKPFSFEELVCRVNQNLDMLDLVEENRHAAYRDFLTDLPNRRCFFTKAPDLLAKAIRLGQHATVAMLDIDHFKQINDTWGHDAGDEVLRAVGQMLNRHFHDQLVARLGGEEFAVFCTGKSADLMASRFEAFRAELATHPVSLDGHSTNVTISIGLASGRHEDLDAFVRAADVLLYQAKGSGRNRLVRA